LLNTSIAKLVDQIHNLNKELGKAFVNGLVGGSDFVDTLQNIIALQKNLIDKTEILGIALSNTWKTLNFLVDRATLGGGKFAMNFIINQRQFEKQTKQLEKLTIDSFNNILNGIQGKFDRLNLERLIAEVKTKIKLNKVDVTIDKDAVLPQVLIQLEKQLQELPVVNVPIQMQLETKEISTEEANQIIDALIKDQIERLKLDGATDAQLLKIEDKLRRQFDVNDDIVKQKQRQLDIERAITEEQKSRITFSDESAKLAEIAKTEGIQTAVAIGEVLNNTRDFNTFMRQGGKNAEILKTQFEDFIKNKELEQFFKGERVLSQPGLRGGERIPISELGGKAREVTPIRATTDFEVAKVRLGLEEVTESNVSALKANTVSLESLIQTYNMDIPLKGTQAQQFVASKVAERQFLEIQVNIDGKQLKFAGTPEAIRTLANQVSVEVAKAVEDKLVNDMNTNNSAPISKATDGRVERF